jgi:hypothetical protein
MPMCLCKRPITREAEWPFHCARCRGIPLPEEPPLFGSDEQSVAALSREEKLHG